MTTIHITRDSAIRALREAVAERGEDFVYTDENGNTGSRATCKYMHGDQPGCIVGNVLIRLGLDKSIVNFLDVACYGKPAAASEIPRYVDPEDVKIENAARDALDAAQSKQDLGYRWGEALRAAERVKVQDEEDF